jgi:DNA-binding transcriptional ArsR family regulator
LVCVGLHYAAQPDRSWPSFPAYVDGLAAQDPALLRDRLFEAYEHVARMVMEGRGEAVSPISRAELLADLETYLNYLQAHFPCIDVPLESEAYDLLKDPPAMQEVIVSHMRAMWDEYLAAEWERVVPRLQKSIKAFQRLDFSGKTAVEIARTVIGHELDENLEESIAGAQQLVFVPSAHTGPYISKFEEGDVLGIIFGARLPEGAQAYSSALTRSELLMQLSALTDDTRLCILKMLAEEGERCAPSIIDGLELSQSAASRHLRQLSATGYVTARRREGAKCYTLNRDRIRDIFRALEQFLELS